MAQEINATIRGKQSNIPYEKKIVVLGGNMVGGKNILTQDMLPSENTKYIIKWAFDLNTNTITMPVGSALEFNGGSINNGTIVINDTSIFPAYSSLIKGSNLTVEGNPSVGTYNFVEGLPVWWDGSEWKRGTDFTQEIEEMQEDIDAINEALQEYMPDHRAPIVIPTADEEDITNIDNEFKLKDKMYSPEDFSGMGKIHLRKNLVNKPTLESGSWIGYSVGTYVYLLYWYEGVLYDCYKGVDNYGLVVGDNQVAEEIGNYDVNRLPYYVQRGSLAYTELNGLITITLPDGTTISGSSIHDVSVYSYEENIEAVNMLLQDMFYKDGLNNTRVPNTNSIFIIQYDYELAENITIPKYCILKFDGGSIAEGTLVGQNTILVYSRQLTDVLPNVTRQGTFVYNNTLSADEESLTENGNLVKIKDEGVQGIHLNDNVVDKEDIFLNSDHKLQFKDKAYAPANYSGLGRKYLRKNIVNDVNTLTQSMINEANTIYVIQYDYTLGENVTIPANCVLEFDGGSLLGNYDLIFQNTTLEGNPKIQYLINTSGTVTNHIINVCWFGAISGTPAVINNSIPIQHAINVAKQTYATVFIPKGSYYCNYQIAISDCNIEGQGLSPDGSNGTILRTECGDTEFLIFTKTGSWRPQIKNITLNSLDENSTGIYAAKSIECFNVGIFNYRTNLVCNEAYNFYAENCVFNHAKEDGVRLQEYSNNCTFINCIIGNNTRGNQEKANIIVNKCDSVKFISCEIDAPSTGYDIICENSYMVTFDKCYFEKAERNLVTLNNVSMFNFINNYVLDIERNYTNVQEGRIAGNVFKLINNQSGIITFVKGSNCIIEANHIDEGYTWSES